MIQPYCPQHRERVMEIWLESTVQGHPFLPRAYWEKNYPVVRDQYLPLAETALYVEEGEILGFLSLLDGSFIGALFVDPAHQGKGVGRALLEDAKRRCTALTLAAYAQNHHAVRFYQKQGFLVEARQQNEDSGLPELILGWKAKGKL